MLLVRREERHLACENCCSKTPRDGTVIVSECGYRPKYHMGTKSFGLFCEEAQDKDDWRLRIKGQPANPGLPGKWPLQQCCVYVSITAIHPFIV